MESKFSDRIYFTTHISENVSSGHSSQSRQNCGDNAPRSTVVTVSATIAVYFFKLSRALASYIDVATPMTLTHVLRSNGHIAKDISLNSY